MSTQTEQKADEAPQLDVGQNWPDGGGPLRLETNFKEDEEPSLILDLDGFEGPMDLLLDLARQQKVDIAKISVLALADQYLAFINAAKKLRLELAADYLVMAAWLAYLKSRLLLPDPEPDEEVPAEELAARLAFRLQRLDAMREAAAQLMARNRLGRDVFGRGEPEPVIVETQTEYADNLFDLLRAYAERRTKNVSHREYKVKARKVWTVKHAREILERLVGDFVEWGRFDRYLAEYMGEPEERAGIVATSFTACLEMAREGKLELRQEKAYGPLFLRTPKSEVAGVRAES